MSSIRVRATNKIMAKLGAAKGSKNIQFDLAFANFDRAAEGVAALDTALRSYENSLRAMHSSGNALLVAIDGLANSPDASSEMKQFTGELKAAFHQIDTQVGNESIAKFEQRVMRPMAGWTQRVSQLRHETADFQSEKLVFDHYTRKIMTLREARDKRSSSGKPEKPKDVEKLARNEEKLAASTNTYRKISEDTIRDLHQFVETREQTLMPLLTRVLEFRVQYATRVYNESQRMQAMVKSDSPFDGMLAKLERLLPSSGARQKAEAPEPEVRSFTFEGFTGEAAPQVENDDTPAPNKFDTVRSTATTGDESFNSQPPVFTAHFESPNELVKPESNFFTTPVSPSSPATAPSTPWDMMTAPVAVPIYNTTGVTSPTGSAFEMSSSWPPNGVPAPVAQMPPTGDAARRFSSHHQALSSAPADQAFTFPTDFQNLHSSAMGGNSANTVAYPPF